jgi:hypothetical protein
MDALRIVLLCFALISTVSLIFCAWVTGNGHLPGGNGKNHTVTGNRMVLGILGLCLLLPTAHMQISVYTVKEPKHDWLFGLVLVINTIIVLLLGYHGFARGKATESKNIT